MIFIYRREAQSPNPQPIRGQASCRGPITVPTLTRGSGAHCTVGRTMPPPQRGNVNAVDCLSRFQNFTLSTIKFSSQDM